MEGNVASLDSGRHHDDKRKQKDKRRREIKD